MGVLVKIAYRNLREHKTKTMIIGSLIALGMVILVVGNSALDTATAGIRANYIENYTGHVVVAAAGVESPALTPDGAMQTFDQPVPSIPRYPEVVGFLDSYRGVRAMNPVITGMALTQIDGEGFGVMQFYGVDPVAYRSFFTDNLDLVEGSFLSPGEPGLVISEIARTMLRESSRREIGVGDSVLLTSQSKLYGTRIREIEIVGVFEFRNATLVLDFISFIDLENARVLNGMTGIADLEAVLSERERSLLGAIDEDELFGDELFGEDLVSNASAGTTGDALGFDLDAVIGDASERTRLSAVDENAWHYVQLKLDSEAATGRVVRDLNRRFVSEGWDLVAFEWLDGAGQIARFTFALKTVFNILVVLVAVVAVIIIMNTLVISVTERIPEIGTMRAIGAQKRFVRRMVMLETLMIAVAAGGVGVAIGAAITAVLGAVGIESTNIMLQIFMGGPVLNPVVSIGSVATSLLAMVAAGVLASLYPAAIALRIAPVTAMNITN
jgi:ABC-type lipoprotein release transport system permease subunit